MTARPLNWKYWLGTLLVFMAISDIVRLFSPTPTQAPVTPAVTESAPIASSTALGETVTVRRSKGFWPCGSTLEAFDELMKWAVRGDNPELKRAMVRTRSFALNGGMSVKILDSGFEKRRVRVLTNDAGQTTLKDEQGTFPADPRIGPECWVTSQALQ